MRKMSLPWRVPSLLRQSFVDQIDATIDDTALHGQKTVVVRIVTLLFVAVLLGANTDVTTAIIWVCLGLASETGRYWAGAALGRDPANPLRSRLLFLGTAWAIPATWSGLAILCWVRHLADLEIAAILILMTQLIHAQAFTYRSVPLLSIIGGIPTATLLLLPWIGRTVGGLNFFTDIFATLLAIGYALASVYSNRRTARALQIVQDELEHFAYFDALTSLANRRLFTARLRELIVLSGRQHERFALLLIDIDRFKDINDTLGHDAGDALLVAVGERLRRAVRPTDHVARLGGDEFAILLTEIDKASELKFICAAIAGRLAQDLKFNGTVMRSTASVGVAIFPDNGEEEDSLYKSADLALYEAKRSGRNIWRYSDAWRPGKSKPGFTMSASRNDNPAQL